MLVEPIGHSKVREVLELELPVLTLFLGPKSVGKRTMAEYLAHYHGVLPVDLRQIDYLSTDNARDLKNFASRAPFGKFKLVVARLDRAQESAINALLKILEEPPPRFKFILTCSGKTLATIISRSHVYRMGLLSTAEVERVLTERMGMTPEYASKAAALSRGQIEVALNSETNEASRSSVLSVLKSIHDRDRELFEKAMTSWDEESRELLMCWFREAVTGNWSVFTESETFKLSQDQEKVWKMLRSMYKLSGARAKLAVRVAFDPFLNK